ncbi:MAG: 4-hydroxy-tetrahydrodipicolinate synthase [Acidobacteria bacterium]|nr:4-hydroxy-tetrahydrodipicolinate synthase [Acidobacteriota bacterium]
MKNRFVGLGTALVTPFKAGGDLDEKNLRRLVRRQIRGKIDFLVPLGTTGEAHTLNEPEYFRVVEICLEEAAGRTPVLAGAGSNNTARAVTLVRQLQQMGVDGTLQVVPYYNKPTQEGQVRHFSEIAAAAPLPMVIYNIQGRTAVNMATATLMRLAAIDNVVAVKEASGNFTQVLDVLQQRPKGFAVLSGDDLWTLPIIACGGDGVISVLSNLVPGQTKRLVDAARSGRLAAARKLHSQLLDLVHALFMETNPIPVKTALSMLGLIEEQFRLPLVPMQAENRKRLLQVLREAGIGRRAEDAGA